MRKILFSLIAFAALTFNANAQWLRPAREVWSATNTWTFIPSSNNTSQAVHDWLDDYLVWADPIIRGSVLDGSSWTNLPDTNAVQSVFDWIDSHWPANIDINEQYMPGSNIVGAVRSGPQWTLPASGVPVSTSSWEVLNPASTNAQATFDALDEWAGYVNSNLNVATVAGAAKLAYNNDFGANKPTNSFINGSKAIFTNGMDSAVSSNTNILKWETNGRLTVKRPGTYFYYSSQAAFRTSSAGVFAYAYHYSSAGALKASSSIMTVEQTPDTSEGAGVLVAIDAEVDDYFITQYAAAGTNTWQGTVVLGAQYIFAYKVYNTD